MQPAWTLDACQWQDIDQVTQGDIKVESRRDNERRPILALFAATHGIEVHKPDLTWLNRRLPHAELPSQPSVIWASASASAWPT